MPQMVLSDLLNSQRFRYDAEDGLWLKSLSGGFRFVIWRSPI